MDAFIFTGCMTVIDKKRFPDLFQIAHCQVMKDAVSEISRKNFAQFGISNDKTD